MATPTMVRQCAICAACLRCAWNTGLALGYTFLELRLLLLLGAASRDVLQHLRSRGAVCLYTPGSWLSVKNLIAKPSNNTSKNVKNAIAMPPDTAKVPSMIFSIFQTTRDSC